MGLSINVISMNPRPAASPSSDVVLQQVLHRKAQPAGPSTVTAVKQPSSIGAPSPPVGPFADAAPATHSAAKLPAWMTADAALGTLPSDGTPLNRTSMEPSGSKLLAPVPSNPVVMTSLTPRAEELVANLERMRMRVCTLHVLATSVPTVSAELFCCCLSCQLSH